MGLSHSHWGKEEKKKNTTKTQDSKKELAKHSKPALRFSQATPVHIPEPGRTERLHTHSFEKEILQALKLLNISLDFSRLLDFNLLTLKTKTTTTKNRCDFYVGFSNMLVTKPLTNLEVFALFIPSQSSPMVPSNPFMPSAPTLALQVKQLELPFQLLQPETLFPFRK